MTQDEACRWLRAASGALSVAHAVAFGAQRCAGTADSFNIMPPVLMLFRQQQQAARRDSVLVRPPRGIHAGAAFVQARTLASRAAPPPAGSFQLPWERAPARQAASKRQRPGMLTSPWPERVGPRCSPADGAVSRSADHKTNLRRNRGAAAQRGGLPPRMAAVYGAHQPQPVRAPRLRPPPPPPSPPSLPPSFSARPASEVQPRLGGEGGGSAPGQGSAADPPLAEAREPVAAGTSASGAPGVSSDGKTAETGDRLPPPPKTGDVQMAQPGATTSGTGTGEGKGEAREGARRAVAEAVGGDVEWCPRAARERACEAVPLLAEAFRQFDEKHPGATIIYLHHYGSRMYGTSTPNSDVDVKGIFIPDREVEAHRKGGAAKVPVEAEAPCSGVDPEMDDSEGCTRPPSQPQEAGDRKLTGDKDVTFWYSTGDTRSMNTKNDIDVELISLDKFFGQLLRSEVNGVEVLHSMLFEDLRLISDPDIVPLILGERRWLVSKRLSSWVGMVMSHVHKYRKVTHRSRVAQRRLVQRRRELNAALLREARLAADAAAATEPTAGAAVGAAPASTLPSPSPPSWSSNSPVAVSVTAPSKEEPDGGGKDSAGPLAAPAETSRVRRLGVASRGVTEAPAAGGADESSGEPRRLGVLSRGGVEVGGWKASGDNEDGGDRAEEEEEEEEEEDGDCEAKERARKVRRGKLLQNARRGVMEAEELLATGRLVFPLRPSYTRELLRLKELDCSPRKVETIVAQAKRLKEVAARSGLPDEVSHEKVAAVQAEAMKVHGRRRHRQLPDLAEAGD